MSSKLEFRNEKEVVSQKEHSGLMGLAWSDPGLYLVEVESGLLRGLVDGT